MITDLGAYRMLVAVVDCGSMVGASRVCGYSTGAISRNMASLQVRLGVRLFEPDGRSIRPTRDARILAERAREFLCDAARFESDVRALSADLRSSAQGRAAAQACVA